MLHVSNAPCMASIMGPRVASTSATYLHHRRQPRRELPQWRMAPLIDSAVYSRAVFGGRQRWTRK